MRRPDGVKASTFMAARTHLLTALRHIDDELDKALRHKPTGRAFQRAKALFAERNKLVERLAQFGIDVDDHPAVAAFRDK